MSVDRAFVELNRAATARMRALAGRLTDEELGRRVGEHWTVAIVFAHLAFLDRRALWVLDATQRQGKVVNPDWGIFVNDLSLPFWAAIPAREAARIALEMAEAVDGRLESYPPELLELVQAEYKRYVYRAYHRNEHIGEAEEALSQP